MSIVANKGATVVSTRSSKNLTLLGALVLAATMLAACSATPGNDDTSAVDPTPTSAATATPTHAPESPTPPPESPPTAIPLGPLDEYTFRIWRGSQSPSRPAVAAPQNLQEWRDNSEQWRRQTEEYIAACMAEQGFVYIPELSGTVTASIVEGPMRGTREFAEHYGFGISADSGTVPGHVSMGWNATRWLNSEAQVGWSSAQLEAWMDALIGVELAEFDPDMSVAAWLETGGCSARATLAFSPEYQTMDEFAALSAEMDRFPDSLVVYPPMMALNAEWTACLARAGYPGWLHREQLQWAMWDEWLIVNGWLDTAARFAAHQELLQEWDWEAAPDGPPGWTAGDDGEGEWDIVGLGGRSGFIEREFDIALADMDCREALDFDARALAINHQLQQEFVDRNRDELEAWATAVETLRDNH